MFYIQGVRWAPPVEGDGKEETEQWKAMAGGQETVEEVDEDDEEDGEDEEDEEEYGLDDEGHGAYDWAEVTPTGEYDEGEEEEEDEEAGEEARDEDEDEEEGEGVGEGEEEGKDSEATNASASWGAELLVEEVKVRATCAPPCVTVDWFTVGVGMCAGWR